MSRTERALGGALVLILGCVVSAVVACNDQQLAGPRGPHTPPIAFSQGAPDVPVQGCAKWQVTLTGGTGITVTSVSNPSCGPIVPVLDSAASYNSTTKIVSLPLAVSNTWTRQVLPPARAYAWNDSIAITTPSGLSNGTSGTYLRLTGMDSTIGGSAAQLKNARLWRYDTLLAAHGQPQILPAGGKSRRRTLQITVVSGNPTVFTVLVRVQAQVPYPVPGIPPVGTPLGTYADTNLVLDTLNWGQFKVVKNTMVVGFAKSATQAQRQAAVDSINGIVVGGFRIYSNGDGVYLVRVPVATGAGLLSAQTKLHSLPQVDLAEPLMLSGSVNGRIPHDGAGWQKPDYSYLGTDRTGATWALKAIRAPLAWGCDTGSISAKIAIVDRNMYSSPDLSPVSSFGVDSEDTPTLRNSAHGQHVASIAAATGNNDVLMTGVAWRSQLRLYDYFFEQYANKVDSLDPALWMALSIAHAAEDGALVINVSSGIDWHAARDTGPVAGSADEKMVTNYANTLKTFLTRLAGEAPPRRPLLVLAAGNDRADARLNGFSGLKDARYGATPDIRSRILVVGGSRKASDTFFGTDPTSPTQGSDWGPLVDVVAPAEQVPGLNGNGVVDMNNSGTSFAAPFVTGVAGLLLSFDPRLSTDSLAILIKTGAANGGRAVPDGHGNTLYMLDAYEALKAAGARRRAPLCGNRVWGIDNVVSTRRSGNVTENLFTFGSNVGPIEHLQVAHGGHWLELNDPASGTRFRLTFADTGWASGPATCVNCAELSGAARSGDAYTFGGAVHSHGGDTSLYWDGATRPPYSSLPKTFRLIVASGSSSVALGPATTDTRSGNPDTFAGAPGALAYSPTGDFALYSTYDYPVAGGWFDTHIYRVALTSGQVSPNPINLPQQDASWLAISEDGTELSLGSTYQGGCGIEYWSLKTNTMISFVEGLDTLGSTTNNAYFPTCFLGGSFSADRVASSGVPGATAVGSGAPDYPTPPAKRRSRFGRTTRQ